MECSRHGGTCRCSGRGSGDIYPLGGLSSARVVGAAGGSAGAGGALVDALVVLLGADVVRHRLRVFRCVGGDIIAADARVAQGIGRAVILNWRAISSREL